MNEIEQNEAGNKSKKVLVTGGSAPIVEGLIKSVQEKYLAESCPADVDAFVTALSRFHPHAVVICLRNESAQTLETYEVLQQDGLYQKLPVIAIGKDEDCNLFSQIFSRNLIQVLTRPINMSVFADTLDQFTTTVAAQEVSAEFIQDTANTESSGFENELEKIAELQIEAAAASVKKNNSKIALQDIHGRKTILVVDDDVRILNIIKLFLQELFDVVIVPSGKLALKYLSKNSADLVLLDYMMPGEDGPAVLQQIREKSPHPAVPVLFLTGVADEALVMRGLGFHPDGYCLKPITQNALIERIAAILLKI